MRPLLRAVDHLPRVQSGELPALRSQVSELLQGPGPAE